METKELKLAEGTGTVLVDKRAPAPGVTDVSDEELIHATLAGDNAAFGRLIQKYYAPLHAMILRHLGQREESEDVLQQVFVQACRHLKSFRLESKFYTWIYAIALNRMKNHLRQKKIRQTVSMDEVNSWDEETRPQWPDPSPTPEESVAKTMQLEAIQKALDTLQEGAKSIFILHYFQHMPLEQVASIVGKPLGTVKVYLHRARKTVRKVLEMNPDFVT